VAGAWRVAVELKGFRDLRRELRQEPAPTAILGPWRHFMERLGKLGVQQARAASPRGETGQLGSSNTYAVQNKPFPTWVRVKNTARAKGRAAKRQNRAAREGRAPLRLTKGYAYPGRLNWERKNPRFGWFTKAMQATRRGTQPLLNQTAREIEQEWGK
jgi:hypothetical protein